MFLLNTGPALADSFLDIMGRADDYNQASKPMVYLFSGPIPASLEDIPFDIQHGSAISANAEAAMRITCDALVSPDQKNIVEGDHYQTWVPIKRSVWDIRRSLWRLASKYQYRYDLWGSTDRGIYLEIPSALDTWQRLDEYNYRAEGDGLTSHVYQSYWGDLKWYNGRAENEATGWYGSVAGGRYPVSYNHGQAMEFDQDVTVTAVEFRQHSNTTYTSNQISLEYWDETAGEYVQIVESGFNSENEYLWVLPEPITSKKFIFSGVDTGKNNWYLKYVSLMSDVEPYNTDTVDLTWALVVPGLYNMYGNAFYESNTESHTEKGRHPVLMCEVGSPRDGEHFLTLNATKNLPGYFNPKCLNFNLEFEDPGV